jgi:uncharacterized protein (TIGR00725 family)
VERLPIVGVMGSAVEPHAERAEPLGRWLAGLGVHLLTGGGGGVMEAVARGFCGVGGRRGMSLGVLPEDATRSRGLPPEGYPNPWVEVAIQTHLPLSGVRGTEPLSRNHLNVLSARVVVALPGGAGTASEVALALRYGRPLVAFLRSRSELPDLPDGVAVEGELSAVELFVARTLRLEPR